MPPRCVRRPAISGDAPETRLDMSKPCLVASIAGPWLESRSGSQRIKGLRREARPLFHIRIRTRPDAKHQRRGSLALDGSIYMLPPEGFSHRCPNEAANADQLRVAASPTKRAMTTAGNRTPKVDKKVASILAGVLTA